MNSQILSKIKSDKILNEIIKLADTNIYLIGGAVRDYAQGNDVFDRDIVIENGSSKDFVNKIKESLGGTVIPLDEENKIYRIVLKDKENFIDIVEPIGGSINDDIKRRDLTINAIAVNLKTFDIVDLAGGLEDLHKGIIRQICEENFIDDPLRLLRVFRFQAMTGFSISKDTIESVKKYSKLITQPSKERVNYELMKLFSGKFSYEALKSSDDSGLLEYLFPFVKELKKVPPNTHHHLDLFNHSLEVVRQLQLIYEQSDFEVKKHLNTVDFGGFSRLAHLKLAGFMHDIGKFSTWTIENDTGRHRFIKHDDVGAKMSIPILKSLKFSKKQTDYISTLIKNHIYPSAVMQSPEINDKIMMRYVRKMEDNSIDAIMLAMADRLSARGVDITEEIVKHNLSSLEKLLQFYMSVRDTLKPLPILLNGNEIMDILSINPSPKLGKILEALHDQQLNGQISTKKEAIIFVKNFKI